MTKTPKLKENSEWEKQVFEKFRDRFRLPSHFNVYFPKLDADEVIDFFRKEICQLLDSQMKDHATKCCAILEEEKKKWAGEVGED